MSSGTTSKTFKLIHYKHLSSVARSIKSMSSDSALGMVKSGSYWVSSLWSCSTNLFNFMGEGDGDDDLALGKIIYFLQGIWYGNAYP